MRITFRIGDTVQVVRLGTTSNDKIEGNKKRKIVQTYSFSKKQFELIATGAPKSMKIFFSLADTNCLDCPYNTFGKCYTHKFNQYVGFISMLKSISNQYPEFNNIPEYSSQIKKYAVSLSKNTYVRFGTYGEPSIHPVDMIEEMISVSDTYTGYTHQWNKGTKEINKYFMASVHSEEEAEVAKEVGYRSFIAIDEPIEGVVNCPASKEGGNKSTCSACGLCSGVTGKGSKSIYILNH